MSIDKSLKKKGGIIRARNVLKRDERIARLLEQDKFDKEDGKPFGIPKVRVYRLVARKTKKKEEKAEGADAAKPAAGAAKPGAAAKPAAGGDKKK